MTASTVAVLLFCGATGCAGADIAGGTCAAPVPTGSAGAGGISATAGATGATGATG